MNWRKLAVCTVGLVLALLLGGLPNNVDQIHSAVNTDASVVYAAQSGTAACPEIGTSTPGVVTEGCRFYFRCRVIITPEGPGIECEIGIECEF